MHVMYFRIINYGRLIDDFISSTFHTSMVPTRKHLLEGLKHKASTTYKE